MKSNGSFDLLKNNEVTDETTKNEESVNEFEVGLAKIWYRSTESPVGSLRT